VADFLAQAILHGFIAALFVEALIRAWKVRDAEQRLRLRLLALGSSLLLPAALRLLAPFRGAEWFEDGFALFSIRRWRGVRLYGVSFFWMWFALLAGSGSLLFLLDLIPYLRERLSARAPWPEAVDVRQTPVGAVVLPLAQALSLEPPPTIVLETGAPILFVACQSGREPRLVLSRGLLERLDARELRAALAHELGHVARRDPLLSWILMAVRALLFFSPASQVLVRAIARDAERRADDVAADLTKDPLALAAGLLKLFRLSQGAGPREQEEALWGGMVMRARSAAVVERCRRLLDGDYGIREAYGRTRLALAGLTVGGLLFFVV
jgi:Zn-dependent protease with chaperone function